MSYDELETDRLKLRMWRESDLDDYAALSADPQVMRYIGPGKCSRGQTPGGASRFSWDIGRCVVTVIGPSNRKRRAA